MILQRGSIKGPLTIHLINPSDSAFGTAVITPRWLYVLATATPIEFGDPVICDETLESLIPESIAAGDVVGIGIHTGNALRGYAVGRLARARGAYVVFGGIHCHALSGGSSGIGACARRRQRRWRFSVGPGPARLRAQRTAENIRRRPRGAGGFQSRALGPASAGPLYVGFGADGSRLLQALLVLFRLAHRRAETAAAPLRCGD